MLTVVVVVVAVIFLRPLSLSFSPQLLLFLFLDSSFTPLFRSSWWPKIRRRRRRRRLVAVHLYYSKLNSNSNNNKNNRKNIKEKKFSPLIFNDFIKKIYIYMNEFNNWIHTYLRRKWMDGWTRMNGGQCLYIHSSFFLIYI